MIARAVCIALVVAFISPRTAAGHETVVVATANPGKLVFFPDIIKMANGALIAVYREATGHSVQDGQLFSTTSQDLGRTWAPPKQIRHTPYNDLDPKLAELTDGSLVLLFYEATTPQLVNPFMMRSEDRGETWTPPMAVPSHMANPTGAVDRDGLLLGWAASHGPITELPNGDLLAPLYGTLPTDPWQHATVVRSEDFGQTWLVDSESVIAAEPSMHFSEPVLTVLPDESILAVIRTHTQVVYVSRSHDNGRTWDPPTPTPFIATSHHLASLSNGRILFAYGDRSGTFSPGRPTVACQLTDPKNSFAATAPILLYDASISGPPTHDQANPSSVELREGEYLTVTYDIYQRSIVGVFSHDADYLSR